MKQNEKVDVKVYPISPSSNAGSIQKVVNQN